MAKVISNLTSMVLVGSWNIGILTPTWFKKQFPKLVKDKEITVEMNLASTNEIRFPINDIYIYVNNNRLTFIPNKDSEDYYIKLSELSLMIYEKLPHTPITQIGHNISYELSENEKFELFEENNFQYYKEYYKKKLDNEYLNIETVKHSLPFENYDLNLTYENSLNKLKIAFNYHYNIKSNNDIKDILSIFSTNLKNSEQVLNNIMVEK